MGEERGWKNLVMGVKGVVRACRSAEFTARTSWRLERAGMHRAADGTFNNTSNSTTTAPGRFDIQEYPSILAFSGDRYSVRLHGQRRVR